MSSEEQPLIAEGRRLVERAAAGGVAARLFGGIAIWLRASKETRAALGRSYPDIDLVAHRKGSRRLRELLEEEGYEPERVFNATHGARRLLFHADAGHQVDVFLDRFEMSHELDLGARLEAEPLTLPAAELLLAKLQVAEINRKDLTDAAMLLLDHEPGPDGGEGRLELPALGAACGDDWGLFTTVTDNLGKVEELRGELPLAAPAAARLGERIAAVRDSLEAAPKSLSWRMRAKVGRKVRWYETPEEVER
ncbi:MAG TPA: hypothetical protein VGG40_03405 [Solirubrobacterales bacterium]